MSVSRRVLPHRGKGGNRIATDPARVRTRLARWLEDQLADKDWSQMEFAGRSRISQSEINGVLRQGRLPNDSVVERLARGLGEPSDEALAAVYLDRIERILMTAPARIQRLFERLLKA